MVQMHNIHVVVVFVYCLLLLSTVVKDEWCWSCSESQEDGCGVHREVSTDLDNDGDDDIFINIILELLTNQILLLNCLRCRYDVM